MLFRSLEQLRAQTWTDWCAVIVDQSAVPSLVVEPPPFRDLGVSEYVPDLIGYPRVVYIHVPWQRGSSDARMVGLAVVQALGCESVVFLDDDDTFDREYLEALRRVLDTNPHADLAACDVINRRDGDGELTVLSRDLYPMPSRMLRLASYRGERMEIGRAHV